MHGWGGDGRNWAPWQAITGPLGWRWACGERGYGGDPPAMPDWDGPGRKVVIGHSLGPHLVPAALLAEAEAVILLAGFGRFVPPGREGRRLQAALRAMASQLVDGPDEATAASRAQSMLRDFLTTAALPDPPERLPPGAADRPVGRQGRQRLLADLQRLERCEGLPAGFPPGVPVLIVEAGADRIVVPEARRLLRQALPQADVVELAGAGHCLLSGAVIEPVLRWLGAPGA